jgi:MFS family permease
MTIQLLSFALGALFWGWISDKIGRRKPFLISAAAAYVLSWIILMYLPWTPGIAGFAIFAFMGFSASGFVITFAAAKEIVHPQLSGMGVSVVNTGCFIGTALAQPLFGYIAEYAVLYEAPVVAKYSDSGSRSQGISGQVIPGVFSAC